jgi:signal transduction histidine kinase
MDRELNACTKILSDLVDFGRTRDPVIRPCPLRQLVESATAKVPAREQVEIINQVPDTLPIPALDFDQFLQVVVHLVHNAVEAIPAGRAGRVVVEATGGGRAPWRLTVTDDGAGIPPDVAGRIFQPLFTTKTKGTGLGLAISDRIVSRHHGTIGVQSTPGQGTIFTIELPAQAARNAA